ncbi:MAG: DUF4038 domain-containing protein [Clostridia bacterium]|nr:DUF4038 domain-containing protein [Clostridia bacterium]
MKNCRQKILCVLLCAVLLAAPVFPAAAVSENASDSARTCMRSFHQALGSAAVVFYRILNAIRQVNQMTVPNPAPLPVKTTPASHIPSVDPSQDAIRAETWRCVELTFSGSRAYADPFSDVTLDVLLIGGGVQYTIPCFWDGGNTWKARVACPAAGRWYYETVCSDAANEGLHGQTGVIECAQYDGDLAVYRHGFPTTGAGKKYFTYADGTPFFYLGDTHWSLGDETADMVREITAKRTAQGFSVWQSEPIGEKFNLADGVTEADLLGLHAYDEKFRIIADAGLTHANAAFFFPSDMHTLIVLHGGYADRTITGTVNVGRSTVHDLSDTAKAYLDRLSRYWVARYGAYPVMWTLGQETDNDFYWSDTSHPDWNALNNPYKLVAQYMAQYDAYAHPLTAHQENTGATCAYGSGEGASERLHVFHRHAAPSAFRDVPAHNFYAAQWSPSKTGAFDAGIVKDYWFNSQGKPAINYEGQYCYLWTKNFGARMQGWTAYLSGLYGYGWGGQDTWSYLNIYNEEEQSDDGVDVITPEEKKNATWRDALEYPSSYQVGYMRAFLEDGRWWELIPRFDNKSYFVPRSGVYSVCASDADNSEIVLYFYSFSDPSVAQRTNATKRGGVSTGTLGCLEASAQYRYQWFDPVSGRYGAQGTFRASALGTYYIGEKPSATDWALRITRE